MSIHDTNPVIDFPATNQEAPYDWAQETVGAEVIDFEERLSAATERGRVRNVLTGTDEYVSYDEADYIDTDSEDGFEDGDDDNRTSFATKAALGAVGIVGAYFVTDGFKNVGYNITHIGEVVTMTKEAAKYALGR